MYKLLIAILVISIIGVGLLVADSALQVKAKVSARNVEMEQMLSSIGK